MSSFLRGSAGMFRPLKQFACLSEDNLRDLDSTLELLATPCGGVAEMLCGCQLGDSLCSRVFEICASSCTAHVCVLLSLRACGHGGPQLRGSGDARELIFLKRERKDLEDKERDLSDRYGDDDCADYCSFPATNEAKLYKP